MLGDGTQTFTVTGSALRCKAKSYIAVMNLAAYFQGQMQFALNKKLEHCAITLCTVSIKGASRLFGCT